MLCLCVVSPRTSTRKTPVTTIVVLAINLAVDVSKRWLGLSSDIPVSGGGCLRLSDLPSVLVGAFTHRDAVHLAENMILLVVFSLRIERRLGTLMTLITYIASGVAGHVMQCRVTPLTYATTGASAAICGLLGAHAALFRLGRLLLALYFGLICLVASWNLFRPDEFALVAHCGGMLTGAVTGLAVYTFDKWLRIGWSAPTGER